MLRDFPCVVVRLRCLFCRRGGDYRTADVAAKHGSYITMGRIIVAFVQTCAYSPWNPARKPQKYGAKCGAYCLDLRRQGPPDLPPSMSGLHLVEGDGANMLPATPAIAERRKRAGGKE